ncbi:TorD/DmsD family molecular chaperone [Shewanella psychromarinicola]|uniref:Uncharacterized protein n=1 Tax=Shewanella psychromarinicola TaxID=2487742 RepID=A0A3N4E1R0_9GAMM|nr:molecular chaperone TorD family protein [Shewanella psychromarinicola]AZG35462.1 hypothetical protein EGC80_11430 [Shewanella psychromarinicola]MCL1084119.1 molecular chaperone TorD family protein [Shewanella psychromarinicola]RPA31196.1 hypothetical protein EGC77_14675 [Shewanella psychromarinicola]
MQPEQDYMMSAACCKLFSTLFYKRPSQDIIDILKENKFEVMWPEYSNKQKKVLKKLRDSVENESFDSVKSDFFRLFIGSEKKLAYPWGSVYTDQDNLMFGESTLRFKEFCRKSNVSVELEVNEPLDHIGVIFSVLSVLFEKACTDYNLDNVVELMREHLLPWFYRFIYLMKTRAITEFYQSIAALAEQYVNYWEEELEIDVEQVHWYA